MSATEPVLLADATHLYCSRRREHALNCTVVVRSDRRGEIEP